MSLKVTWFPAVVVCILFHVELLKLCMLLASSFFFVIQPIVFFPSASTVQSTLKSTLTQSVVQLHVQRQPSILLICTPLLVKYFIKTTVYSRENVEVVQVVYNIFLHCRLNLMRFTPMKTNDNVIQSLSTCRSYLRHSQSIIIIIVIIITELYKHICM